CLRSQPRVYESNAWCCDPVCRHQRSCSKPCAIESEVVECACDAILRGSVNQQRTSSRVLSVSVKRFLCCLNLDALEFVYEWKQRNLSGVVYGYHRAGPLELSCEGGQVFQRRHAGLQDCHIGHAHHFNVEKMRERPA